MKNLGNKNMMITFSDAMKEIDTNRDFNEFSEMNSSTYFIETMNNANDEINLMMSSPLISNYYNYKKPRNKYLNMINKEYLMKRFILINNLANKKKNKEVKYIKKKKIKINPVFERLANIKLNFANSNKNESKEEKNKNHKLLLTSGNIAFFPKINKNFKGYGKKKIKTFAPYHQDHNSDDLFLKTKIENNRYFSKTHDKNLMNLEINNHYRSKKNFLKNMYDKYIKNIENIELQSHEKIEFKFSPKIKLEKPKPLENRLNNDDTEMNNYLIENINTFNKNNKKKIVNITKQINDLKLKRDPILKLSEQFAYMNRKPLLTMFNLNNKEEDDKTPRKSPLIELKIKDEKIMKNLEKDNRNMSLLMKRLDEDQMKYKKGGYYFMITENVKENEKSEKIKKNKDYPKENIDEEKKILVKTNDDNILKPSLYESQKNIPIKRI